ncbi:beta-carotene 15,15'-monooxygenase [Epilithonimonas sp.]|uniref:beta-carotene 15,15'-monooxygenase n=1 Tax=Epilithonimonas sp. TaxID=2894511 RepID=UPI00289C4A96|nr:beta-carotene 15,15'-monooxygenase [Epilithonimonas sp.]
MPNSEDFDIDSLKKSWQEQVISDGYNQDEIEVMLNKKSRNYVKYILWISIAEFIVFGLINFISIFSSDFHTDFTNILNKLQIRNQPDVQFSLDKIYNSMRILSLFITGIFVVVFYLNYKKINVESNLRKFIIHIIKFKKTVNLFIFSNVLLLVLFIGSSISLLTITIRRQNIHVDNPTFLSLLIAVSLSLLISIVLILLYYKLAYGIILKRLSKNLNQLEKIDSKKEN